MLLLCDSVQVYSEMEVSENQANSNWKLVWMLSSGEAGEDSIATVARVCLRVLPLLLHLARRGDGAGRSERAAAAGRQLSGGQQQARHQVGPASRLLY